MTWLDESSPGALDDALAAWRFEDADAHVAAFLEDVRTTGRLVPAGVARRVLDSLRTHRRFGPLEDVAAALVQSGQEDPTVRRHLAQARIESPGGLTRAIGGLLELEEELEGVAASDADAAAELGECLGLLGRAYKQFYADARPTRAEPRAHDLERATAYYKKAFERGKGDPHWHAINAIALETHAERVKRGKVRLYPAAERAGALLAEIDARESSGELRPWDLANRVEALLACGRFPDAIQAVEAYLAAPELTLFMLHGTRRQLEQLYMLDADTPPGDTILPLMTARIAAFGEGFESVDMSPAQGKRFERVLGDVSYKPLAWLKAGVERAQCVARLGPSPFEGMGTGFVFDGALVSDKHAGRHLLLTNAHVCSPDPKVQRRCPWPAEPTTLKATFLAARGAGEPVGVGIKAALFSSAPDVLDATLLELDGPPPEGAVAPPAAGAPPAAQGQDARVNVIGHPKGLDVRVSMQDNKVVGREDPFLRYRTPTDPGSSGSPVFNQAWELVALHHAGDSGANEGILLDPLLQALRKELA